MTSDHQQNSITLRPMTTDDYSLVDGIFAEAFASNEITRLIIGTRDVRSRLIRFNRTTVRGAQNRGTIATVDGRPAGAMIQAESPKCEPSGIASLRFIFDALLATRFRFALAGGISREASKNHPEWPHRHLSVLGVIPEFQGTGVGSALLRQFCNEADVARSASYLETDSEAGKRLYERFGFQEVNRTNKDGMNFIYMWRAAVYTVPELRQPSN